MASVGQHTPAPFSSPVNTGQAIDANIVRGNDNVLRTKLAGHDNDATIHNQSGPLASRPATASLGSVYYATDSGSERIAIYTASGWVTVGSSTIGNVFGPAVATDNAVARYDGTTGKLIQDSLVTIADTGATTIAAGSATPALTVKTTGASQLRLEYDVSNYLLMDVSSTGAVVLNAVGTATSFNVADRLFSSLPASANSSWDVASTATDSTGTSSARPFRATATSQKTSGTLGLIRAVEGIASSNAAGSTLTQITGLYSQISNAAGTVITGHAISAQAISTAMTNAYGLFIGDVTGGTSLNYAIYTGLGAVRFGGAVTADTTLTVNSTLTTSSSITSQGSGIFGQSNSAAASMTLGSGTQTGFGAFYAMRAPSGNNRMIQLQSGMLNRWIINANSSAESGSDAGTNFELAAYTDAGALIDLPISITRAAGGQMTVSRSTRFSAVISTGASPTAGVSAYLRNTHNTATSYGLLSQNVFNTAVTSARAGEFRVETSAAAFTMTTGIGVNVRNAVIGAGSAIATQYGLLIENMTSGATNYAIDTGTGLVRFGDVVNINTASGLQVQGIKVVGAQGATIADPTGGVTVDAEARTAINTIIDRLQAHGLIA